MDNQSQPVEETQVEPGKGRGGKLKAKPIGVYFPSDEVRREMMHYASKQKPKRSMSGMFIEALSILMEAKPLPKKDRLPSK